MRDILAIDIGTTTFKIGIYSPDLKLKYTTSRVYEVNIYDRVKTEIDPNKWWSALQECCNEFKEFLPSVGIISTSVTTPGLVPIADSGRALGPAILFFDGRSHEQARWIRERVGEDYFLEETCNLPVSGGSSLSSILWIKDNQTEIWKETVKFGHCNTYIVKRLTGKWGIDPSTTSITGMYNTARNDLTWNERILEKAGIPISKLPPLFHSYSEVGRVLPEVAEELHFSKDAVVLCGGNDAALAALAGGLTSPGDISAIHGTCDISCVCVDHPVRSPNFNVRCHVLPNRWLIFFVLNTGGKAFEWFHSVFCQDMTQEQFYNDYIPRVLSDFFDNPDIEQIDTDLPNYVPFLQGSRYNLEQLTAAFTNITLETTRESLLLSLIKGNLNYTGDHLNEVAKLVNIKHKIVTTGGAARIKGFLKAKRQWVGDFEFEFRDQSSLFGAAMLGQVYIKEHNQEIRKIFNE